MLKHLLIAGAMALALCGMAKAQTPQQVIQCAPVTFTNASGEVHTGCVNVAPRIPLGYCQLSVTTAVQTSTCTGYQTTATYAAVCNEGSAARWRDDGVAPTTTVGEPLGSGTATAPNCIPMGTTFSALQWIAQSGTAVLNFTFYK